MELVIEYIRDAGDIEKERIVFKAEQDTQLGKYLLAESYELDESRFSSSLKNVYWFPDQELKAGDRVILYTKKGERNVSINEDGSTDYFFYWNLEEPHLKGDKPCIVLLDAKWKAYAVSK